MWGHTPDAGWHRKREQVPWTVAFLGHFEAGEQVTFIRVRWCQTGDIAGKGQPMSQLLAGSPRAPPDSDRTGHSRSEIPGSYPDSQSNQIYGNQDGFKTGSDCRFG